jgi:sugar phosphate isomerase/epimerase
MVCGELWQSRRCAGVVEPARRRRASFSATAASAEAPFLRHAGQGWVNPLPDAPGAQDWPAILRACNRLGYDGLITVIESGWSAGRREAVARHAADCIRRWWDHAQ